MKGRFLARGTAMCPDAVALQAGNRRFIGRRLVELENGRHGFEPVPVDQPSEVDLTMEIARDCREGMLWAADEATAKACGVKFDPTFGGEYQAAKKAPAKGEKGSS